MSVNIPGDRSMVYRQARLLAATILATLVFLLVAIPVVIFRTTTSVPFVLLFLGISVLLAGIYVLNRAGNHLLAARLFVATALLGTWGYAMELVLAGGVLGGLGYLMLPVLFAGLFVAFWPTFLVTAASLLFSIYYGDYAALPTQVVLRGMLLMGMVGAVMSVNAYLRTMITVEVHAKNARLGRGVADRRALMESSPDAVFELDLGMRIVGANQFAKHQCSDWGTATPGPGSSLEAALPEPLLDFVREVSPGPSTTLVVPVQRRLEWDDGEEVHLASLAAVQDEEDTVIGYILRVRDISSIASMERHHKADVEALKRRMLNTAAHELNTPLTPIQLGLHSLAKEMDALAPHQRKALQTIQRNVDRLQIQVKEFLEVAVASEDRVHLDARPVRFDELVAGAMEEVQDMPAVQGLRLAARAESDATVRVDQDRMHRVMVHLIRNAVQHAPRGGHVEVRSQYLEDGQVQFEVRDDGVGFDPVKADALFEPFSSVHEDSGRGFGLYICKRVVEAHGGTIDAKSEGPGKGARFSFRVPIDAKARGTRPPVRRKDLSPIRPRQSVESLD